MTYKFGLAQQRARIYQAQKDMSYGKITQEQFGAILVDIGKKLMAKQQIETLPLEMDTK